MRQEKITRASSLIPNETFRYRVKFLALSKAQTKVLPLPRRLPAPRGRPGSSNSSKSRASRPSGGWSTAQLFLDLPTGSRDGGQTPANLEGS